MIYTNLFRPNNADKTKTSVYYLVESRKYKFSLIFDKKFTSILSGMLLGALMISSVNIGVYAINTMSNQAKLAFLQDDNDLYLNSISSLEGQITSYNDVKTDATNIYNIATKPTKWSSIIESIAEQLPYDSLLTSINTITFKEMTETPGQEIEEDENEEVEEGEEGYSEDEPYSEEEQELTADEVLAANEKIVNNNVIEIRGLSLSMVNISLFLDKLDKLDIFSKVECTKAQRDASNSDFYGFVIYAQLK